MEGNRTVPHGAKCEQCLFGFKLYAKNGDGTMNAVKIECHVARPTKSGFPVVRFEDYCSFHVNGETGERTFAGLVNGNNAIL